MPLNFSDTLATGEGSFFSLVDLTQNRVKGIGYYSTLEEAFDQPADQRTLGFIAIVSDDTSAAVYIYKNPNLEAWADVDSWVQFGSDGDLTPTAYGSYEFEYETSALLVGEYDAATFYDDESNSNLSTRVVSYELANPQKDYTTAYDKWEYPFRSSAIDSFFPDDTVFSTVSYRPHISWGYQHYIELVLDSTYGFTGFSAAAATKIENLSWAQTGGDADDEAIRNFILSIPPEYRAQTYQLAFPLQSAGSPTRLVKLPSVVSDADMINPANWQSANALGLELFMSRYILPENLPPPHNEPGEPPKIYYKLVGTYPETTGQTINIANSSLLSSNFPFAQAEIFPDPSDRGIQKPAHLKEIVFFVRWIDTNGAGWWQDNAAVLKTLPMKIRVEITCKT